MSIRKTGLLAASAAAALMTMPPTAAFAFDVVDWDWQKLVDETVDINVTIDDTIDPTGIVEVEKLQAHFGNITATSTIDGVTNNAPGDANGDGLVTIDEVHQASLDYGPSDSGSVNPIVGPNEFTPPADNKVTVALEPVGTSYGNVNEDGANVDFAVRITGEIPLDQLGGVKDAVDLPSVENAATAVANNQDIYSESAVMLHDAQIAAGAFNTDCGDASCADAFLYGADLIAGVDGELDGTNVHTTLAALATLGAATGYLQPATVSANATVYNILNATVDNSATAVTNNMAVEIAAANPGDATMIADITQWGYANVNATALLDSCYGECLDPAVQIDGYANLGVLDGPIVSNTATAVGNNLSIKVSAPAAPVL
jgi:hypothetical protein